VFSERGIIVSKVINLGNVTVYVEDSYEALGARAADIFAEALAAAPTGVFGFATGGTPLSMYGELIRRYKAGALDFSGITTFNLDEYYPILKSNDQSYDYFMRENLFNHINVPTDRINLPNGEAPDPEIESRRYEAAVRASAGLELQLLGIGENGHIAFNEPADAYTNATNYTSLTESTVQANARFFASADEVPKHALTMGIKTIMLAKKILLVANGAKKAEIMRDALLGDITPRVPASALQLHRDVEIVLDAEAASAL